MKLDNILKALYNQRMIYYGEFLSLEMLNSKQILLTSVVVHLTGFSFFYCLTSCQSSCIWCVIILTLLRRGCFSLVHTPMFIEFYFIHIFIKMRYLNLGLERKFIHYTYTLYAQGFYLLLYLIALRTFLLLPLNINFWH